MEKEKAFDMLLDAVQDIKEKVTEKINNIYFQYFQGIERDAEILPEELNLELKEEVTSDIKDYTMQLFEETHLPEKIKTEVLDSSNQYLFPEIWAAIYRDLKKTSLCKLSFKKRSNLTEEELAELFKNAQERTLWERLAKYNNIDVTKFYDALMAKTFDDCKDILSDCFDEYMSENRE